MNHKVNKNMLKDIVRACELDDMCNNVGITTDTLIDALVEGVTRFEIFSKINKFPIPSIITGLLYEGPDDPNYQIINKVFYLNKYRSDYYYGLMTLRVGFEKSGKFKLGKYINVYIFESIDGFDGVGNEIIEMCGNKYIPCNGVDDYTLGKLAFGKLMKAHTFIQTLIGLITRRRIYDRILKQLCREGYIEKR